MGDHGLELHEFFEVLCMIAVARQPQVRHRRQHDAGRHRVLVEPMPGCLEKLLKVILKKANSDGLAKVLKRVMKEPEIRAIFNANNAPLKKAFEKYSNANYSATKAATVTLENLLGAMNERRCAKDVIVDPKPAISGYYTPRCTPTSRSSTSAAPSSRRRAAARAAAPTRRRAASSSTSRSSSTSSGCAARSSTRRSRR